MRRVQLDGGHVDLRQPVDQFMSVLKRGSEIAFLIRS